MRKHLASQIKLISLEVVLMAAVFLLALFMFSLIVHEAVYEKEEVFDQTVHLFFAAHTSPGLISLMKKISFFGSSTFLLPAYLLLLGWHIYQKKYAFAIDIAVIALSSTAMMFALKKIFHRQRPALPIIKGISGYSFPSGHSLSSFIFCSILAYIAWKSKLPAGAKYTCLVFLVLSPLAIGLSRIILNVHYATDVIGGFCLALAWVIAAFALLRTIRKNRLPKKADPVN